MTPLTFDPAYSAGVRDLLSDPAALRRGRRRRRIWIGGSLVVGLSFLGAGGAIAADSVLPGGDVVTSLSDGRIVTGQGSEDVALDPVPAGTNSLETTLTCLSAGTLTWPDGASMTCGTEEPSTSTYAVRWTSAQRTFAFTATTGTKWRLEYTFSARRTTELATNANGQTYGADNAVAHPDLIAAIATNGREGYISAKEDAAVSCGDVTSPAEAVACTKAHEGKTESIPVYESDGVTKIGVFVIGG